MSNQTNNIENINIFDVKELEKQIHNSDSIERCLNDAIKAEQKKLDILFQEKRKLRFIKSKIVLFKEILTAL